MTGGMRDERWIEQEQVGERRNEERENSAYRAYRPLCEDALPGGHVEQRSLQSIRDRVGCSDQRLHNQPDRALGDAFDKAFDAALLGAADGLGKHARHAAHHGRADSVGTVQEALAHRTRRVTDAAGAPACDERGRLLRRSLLEVIAIHRELCEALCDGGGGPLHRVAH